MQPVILEGQIDFNDTDLTGTPTCPTQPPGTNNTTIASTAFVQANGGGGFSSGQTWTGNLYGTSRAPNTNYQNTTGAPILVHVSLFDGGSSTDVLYVGSSSPASIGVSVVDSATPGDGDDTLSAIVPDGWWYRFGLASASSAQWYELR